MVASHSCFRCHSNTWSHITKNVGKISLDLPCVTMYYFSRLLCWCKYTIQMVKAIDVINHGDKQTLTVRRQELAVEHLNVNYNIWKLLLSVNRMRCKASKI